MAQNLIAQGAEAKIYLTNSGFIIKDRIKKPYRHPTLDSQIRKRRTKREAKILEKAHSLGINVPKPFIQPTVDLSKIKIPYIEGDKLSEHLNSYPFKKQTETMKKFGHQVALLHKNNIIHGDLTTSNVILSPQKLFLPSQSDEVAREALADPSINKRSLTKSPKERVYLIDFGLGFISTKIEDKAVDLHLIKQALKAKHYQNHEELFKAFISEYKYSKAKKVIERLKIVEKRGRYKH